MKAVVKANKGQFVSAVMDYDKAVVYKWQLILLGNTFVEVCPCDEANTVPCEPK